MRPPHRCCRRRTRAIRHGAMVACAAPELGPILVAAEAVIANGQREHGLPRGVRCLAGVRIGDAIEGVDRQARLRQAARIQDGHGQWIRYRNGGVRASWH